MEEEGRMRREQKRGEDRRGGRVLGGIDKRRGEGEWKKRRV